MINTVITLKNFFERAREGTLTAVRCGKCGELAVPPKEFIRLKAGFGLQILDDDRQTGGEDKRSQAARLSGGCLAPN